MHKQPTLPVCLKQLIAHHTIVHLQTPICLVLNVWVALLRPHPASLGSSNELCKFDCDADTSKFEGFSQSAV